MKLKFNKFLGFSIFFLMLPSVFSNAVHVENAKAVGNWEAFLSAREVLEAKAANYPEKISRFLSDKESLLNCISSLYMEGYETERLIIDELRKTDVKPLTKQLYDKDIYKYFYYNDTCDMVDENFKFANEAEAKVYIEVPFMNCSSAYFQFISGLNQGICTQWLKDEALFRQDNFVIRLKETEEPIGIIGFNISPRGAEIVVEIDYFLGKKYQNKGYAKEAAVNLSKHVFGSIKGGIFKVNYHKLNENSNKLASAILENFLEEGMPKYKFKAIDINNMMGYTLEKNCLNGR